MGGPAVVAGLRLEAEKGWLPFFLNQRINQTRFNAPSEPNGPNCHNDPNEHNDLNDPNELNNPNDYRGHHGKKDRNPVWHRSGAG